MRLVRIALAACDSRRMATSTTVLHTTPAVAAKLQSQAQQLEHKANVIAKLKAAKDEATSQAVTSIEITVTAAGLGYAAGRYGWEKIKNVPIAPVVGVLSHAAGFIITGSSSTKETQEYASHFHAVGNGALAAAAFSFGREVGLDQKAKADKAKTNAPATTTAGYWPRAA